ncbi:MAG TPA: Scr1 family TA system antitoxin-like transcriptional regulator [Acidobacteriaceae bacterium]|nr:Scr1 family TA system antitoxin-like transcriptional regulator [Acidobacteriaceae bacterium]
MLPLWERTRQFRIYSPFLIPGPVQIPGYIEALLTTIRDRRPNRVDDIGEAVAVRVAKQHVTREVSPCSLSSRQAALASSGVGRAGW